MTNQSGIHPTAIIEDGAQIGNDVHIGAYSCIGAGVKIADGCHIQNHVVIAGQTTLAANVKVFPFASVGTAPQDLKYDGEDTALEIGTGTTIREHATLNTGTSQGGGLTKVGDNCLIMVGAHVAHDCHIGNNVILVNNATCAGHVVVGDNAVLGGLCAVHQFVRIGNNAMVGGMTGVERDVIPFGSVLGNRARLKGLNVVGLRRAGFDKATIQALRQAYQALFADTDTTLHARAEAVAAQHQDQPPVQTITDFILSSSNRSFCTP